MTRSARLRAATAITALMFLAGGVIAAQQPTKVPKPPSRDTAARPDSTAADSTSDDEEEPARTITTGGSFGGPSYAGSHSERATRAIARWRARTAPSGEGTRT